MTVNPNAPAYPQAPIISPHGEVVTSGAYFANADGMTARTLIAAMAMQGMVANPEMTRAKSHEIAACAVEQADSLILALNTMKEPS